MWFKAFWFIVSNLPAFIKAGSSILKMIAELSDDDKKKNAKKELKHSINEAKQGNIEPLGSFNAKLRRQCQK